MFTAEYLYNSVIIYFELLWKMNACLFFTLHDFGVELMMLKNTRVLFIWERRMHEVTVNHL